MIHGDLQPDSIFNCNGQWKVMDNFIPRNNFLEIQYFKMIKKEPLFIAPELLRSLNAKEKQIQMNFFTCESFSIGMILL